MAPESPLDYADQKRLLQDPDAGVRRALAQRSDARPEVLYYLAEDDTPEVRQAVAANPATPVQADDRLSHDVDDDVRCDLALKIGRLIPDMPEDEQEKIRDLTFEILDRLAQDQLPRVRAILAEELKHTLKAPKKVIRRLAMDVEEIVAAPVLEYSPLLSDDDLREIIAAGCASGALDAISRRQTVSADVSDAVVATFDVAAVATLLTNERSEIREQTLNSIADNAEAVEAWHEPLIMRPELSIRAMRRVAGFVATSLVEMLAQRRDLNDDVARLLREVMQKRLEETTGELQEADEAQARELDERDLLDDDAFVDAIDIGRHDFVFEALATRSGFPNKSVKAMVKSRNASVVTALAWKAGLSMRTAMRLQRDVAHIPPNRMLNARNGFDYPLTKEEMAQQLKELV